MHRCEKCNRSFSRGNNARRHARNCNSDTATKHNCIVCGNNYSRVDALKRHQKSVHKPINISVVSEELQGQDSPTALPSQAKITSVLDSTKKESNFLIINEYERKSPKFKFCRRTVVFKLKSIPNKEENPIEWFKNGINEIVSYILSNVDPNDKIGLTFNSDGFKNPAWLSFRKAKDLTFGEVWDLIGSVFQSKSEGLNTDTFTIGLCQVKLPQGQGKRKRKQFFNNFEEECLTRRGIITITNNDKLCLPRAIVVAKAHVKKNPSYNDIRRNKGKMQDVKVAKLLKKSGVAIPSSGSGIEELRRFQLYLKKYKISVYNYSKGGRELIFEGYNPDAKFNINLIYHEGHYNVITSKTAAFACSYYCDDCHVPFNNKRRHRCSNTCPACKQKTICENKDRIKCSNCNRIFRNNDCFEKHQLFKVCDEIKRCGDCSRIKDMSKEHHCNQILCKICKTYQPENHYCFMKPDSQTPNTDDILFIFYDIETTQDQSYNNNVEMKLHEANICVFEMRCDKCMDIDENVKMCFKCGVRRHALTNNPIEMFTSFVLQQRKLFKRVVVIAHNGQAFDHQFVLKYVLEKTSLTPELIMRGSKIILMKIDNVKFIDSLNYFPMPLSSLPKSFDLQCTIKKGYFPYLFNTKKNEKYVGPIPDASYYCPNSMKTEEERKIFLEWHNEQKERNIVFDMSKEIVEYCINDVRILTGACLKFRRLFLEECNVCPFTEATTIASACNLLFRRNFLKSNTIGIIPRGGYRGSNKQSKVALKWLIEESERRNIYIKHAANSKEVVVNGFKVDGYCEETKQIFEFQGCYFHGHTCLTTNRTKPLHYENPYDTLDSRLERTLMKIETLIQQGYEVVEMWECQYEDQNSIVSENHPLLKYAPLNPRDAFYGGRTENTKSYVRVSGEEKINYIDICSLYPYICKYGRFPVGHPTVYIGDDCRKLNLREFEGLIKCTVLPPRDLYLPVLPSKMNNKLMFVLCRTCGETLNQGKCFHNDEERAITGTWVIEEVKKALEKGYTVLRTYEAWEYRTVQLNENETGLFTKFINKFLKIKQEASGWPIECDSIESKKKYIEDYFEKEGVQLEYDKIKNNGGLRSLAKLILNSFWGKFGQRENQPKTSIVNNPKELFDLLTNPSIEINYIHDINENVLLVNWEYKNEAFPSLSTVNVVIASYVTTQARLKLYSYLEGLTKRICYFDTDSIIYVSKPDDTYEPEKGNFLGDMKDELQEYGIGSYITEFISGGPKNYGFVVYSPSDDKEYFTCRVKGITLNYEARKLVNLETMRKSILEGDETVNNPVIVKKWNISRTKEHDVVTKMETKMYRSVLQKRKFSDYDSLPYGHKKLCN